MSICKIGETKIINGKRYRKEAVSHRPSCDDCAFICDDGCALFALGMENHRISIEDGGLECDRTIWILADDQPESPTATPPRDEVREQRRFQAAVAAMQGMLSDESGGDGQTWAVGACVVRAVEFADALLAELDRTGAGK